MSQTNFTPISIYYSTTASAVPTAANLVPGELAINTADGKLYYEDSSGVVQVLATKSTGSIGGSNTQVQFNNSGSLGGSSGLTWDGSFLTTSSIKNSALTSGRVTYAGASGLLSDSANLTFSGSNLGVNGTTTIGNQLSSGTSGSFSITGVGGAVYLQTGQNTSSASAAPLVFTNSGAANEWMRITSAGNVGIGTSSPAQLLTLNTAGADTMPALGANGGKLGIISGSLGYGLVIGVPSSGTATLQSQFVNGTASALDMSLQPLGGNVGIGTSSPARLLSVENTNTASQEISNIFANSLSNSNYVDVLLGKSATTDRTGVIRFQNGTGAGDSSMQLGLYGQSPLALNISYAGNLGLGVTPSAWSSGYKALQLGTNTSLAGNTGGSVAILSSNAYFDGSSYVRITADSSALYQMASGSHNWRIAGSGSAGSTATFTQAMTLDSSGNLLVGTTSSIGNGGVLQAKGSGPVLYLETNNSGGTQNVMDITNVANAAYKPMRFWVNGYPTTEVGSITCTTSLTSYNVTSDYRLKENIAPMTGALAKVAQLNPVTYKWKTDGSDGQGFIAHELAEIVPDCVTGEKDAVDEDGKPQYQAMDTSHLVATLVSAMQEQQALIESLTTRLNALENK